MNLGNYSPAHLPSAEAKNSSEVLHSEFYVEEVKSGQRFETFDNFRFQVGWRKNKRFFEINCRLLASGVEITIDEDKYYLIFPDWKFDKLCTSFGLAESPAAYIQLLMKESDVSVFIYEGKEKQTLYYSLCYSAKKNLKMKEFCVPIGNGFIVEFDRSWLQNEST
jgi:hypothetical protein